MKQSGRNGFNKAPFLTYRYFGGLGVGVALAQQCWVTRRAGGVLCRAGGGGNSRLGGWKLSPGMPGGD